MTKRKMSIKEKPTREEWVELCKKHSMTELKSIVQRTARTIRNWSEEYDFHPYKQCQGECKRFLPRDQFNHSQSHICVMCGKIPENERRKKQRERFQENMQVAKECNTSMRYTSVAMSGMQDIHHPWVGLGLREIAKNKANRLGGRQREPEHRYGVPLSARRLPEIDVEKILEQSFE